MGRPTVLPLFKGQRATSDRETKAISHSDYSPTHAMVMLQSMLGYDMVIRRMWVMAAGSNFAFNIAARLLEKETWLLLTAYKLIITLYSGYQRRPSTIHHLATVHALQMTTDDTSYQTLCKVGPKICWPTAWILQRHPIQLQQHHPNPEGALTF